MALFVNALLVSVVTCRLWVDAAAQVNVQQVDNAEQFALLCRIYNVAKNPPIHHVDLQDPNNIVNEIDDIRASFAEEKQFNETGQIENSSNAHVKTTITREAAIAQVILTRITQKARTILKEIRKVNGTRNIEKVKAEFAEVIFGEGMNESHLCDGALNDVGGRAATCGDKKLSAKGVNAGKSLVVDFFCLCAMRTDGNGVENVCSVKVGGKGKSDYHGWGDTRGPSGSSSMWASIQKGCVNLLYQRPKSTQEVHEILDDFLKHLETGGVYRWDRSGKESGRKAGMLGTGAASEKEGTDILCDGKKGGASNTPAGVCVYYGSENEWQNIPWLMKIKSALASADIANNQTATIQRNIEKLQMLLNRAEEIYETTKVISEIQNPVAPTNLQTAAKRLTAYNAAWRHPTHAHFISLWLLL